jgi:hypothetical protein
MHTAVAGRGNRPGLPHRRWLAALVATLALTGCASGFVYDRLDWVVAWYVDGLVSLDDAQDQRLHDLVHVTLDWHRRTQLPKYVRLLDEMAVEAAAPLDAGVVARRYAEIGALLDAFLRQVNPGAAGLLGTLRPDQIQELAANLEEENAELWEDLAGDTPEQRSERRLRSALKALQRFYGRLTPPQKALVEARLKQMTDVSGHWIERRRHWQERFLAALGAPPPAGLEAELLDLMLHPDQFDTPEYRRAVTANRQVVFEMIAELSVTLTPEQRRHVQRKLGGWADDLREIAARG